MTRRQITGSPNARATRVLATTVLALALIATTALAFGQDDARNASFPGFRFWMAPESAIDRWPWGEGKYAPIPVETFQDWIAATEESRRMQEYLDGERFLGSVAKLKMEGAFRNDAIEGVGELQALAAPFPQNPGKNAPEISIFPIRPLSFFFWSPDEETAPARKLATYPDGEFYLPDLSPQPRKFRWSQRAERDAYGAARFLFKLPAALETELVIETRDDEIVFSADGVVLLEKDDSKENENDDDDSAQSQDAPKTKKWKIYWGGRSEAELAIVDSGVRNAIDSRRKLGFRQESTYRVALEGIDLVSRFEFESSEPLDGVVALDFDDSLEILSVDWGKIRYANALGAIRREDSGSKRITLAVPPRENGEPLGELKITAFAPFTLGKAPLPTLRLESDRLAWRETHARVAVVKPLLVVDVAPIRAAQTRDVARSRQENQTALSFKLFDPTGTALLNVERQESTPFFDSATDCLFANGDVVAKTTLFFNFAAGSGGRVDLPLAPGWDIDAAQTPTNDALAWTVETIDGVRTLRLAFSKRPVPNQPTRAVISARYVAPIVDSIPVDSLSPINLSDTLLGAHAISLRSEASTQVRITTKNGRPLRESRAKPNFIFGEAQLRDAAPTAIGGTRLYFGDQTVDAVATLENARANYSVDLSGYAALGDEYLDAAWKLRCTPISGARVDRVVFFVAGSNAATTVDSAEFRWRWSTATEPEKRYDAVKLSQEEAESLRAPVGFDAYEIKLTISRSVPFELNLFGAVKTTREINAPLVFFPESATNAAELVVDAVTGRPFQTVANAAIETTPPVAEYLSYDALKKAFRYNPNAIFDDNRDESDLNAEKTLDRQTPSIVVKPIRRGVANYFQEYDPTSSDGSALCWYENYDSHYQVDGSSSSRVSFYLENRGRRSVQFTFTLPRDPQLADADADDDDLAMERARDLVRAVWVNRQKAVWKLFPVEPDVIWDEEWLDENAEYANEVGSSKVKSDKKKVYEQRFVIETQLVPNQRFALIEIEICDSTKRTLGGSKLSPQPLECDCPVVSGIWNAQFPPQYVARSPLGVPEKSVSLKSRFWRFVDQIAPSGSYDEALKTLANRFANRLGVSFDLQAAITEARNVDSGKSALEDLRIDRPTWGDVFGSPTLVEMLFAPNLPDDAEDENDVDSRVTAFGRLEPVPTRPLLFIDRFALARVGIAPSVPLADPTGSNPIERANNLLDAAGLTILFLDADCALVTTTDALNRRSDLETVPLAGARLRRAKSRYDARTLRQDALAGVSREFASPEKWRAADEATSPWSVLRDEDAARGWSRVAVPLGRANEGIYVVNRYLLTALELFTFITILAFSKRFNAFGSRFLVGACGVALAIIYASQYELRAVGKGALFGFATLFVISLARALFFAERNERREQADADSNRNVKTREQNPNESYDGDVVFDDGTESSAGFVDFNKMPEEEVEFLRSSARNADAEASDLTVMRPSYARDESTDPSDVSRRNSNDSSRNDGRISATALLALAILATFLCAVARAGAATPNDETKTPEPERVRSAFGERRETASAASASPASPAPTAPTAPTAPLAPPDALGALNQLFPLSNDLAQPQTPPENASSVQEPKRVFAPVDENGKFVGKYYWIDSDFYRIIRETLRSRPREKNWRVVDALYQGKVAYNSFSDVTTLYELHATYSIVMDSDSATIALPFVDLAANGGAKFDSAPISLSYDELRKELYFIVEAPPGAHKLELFFDPRSFTETNSELELSVMPVPSARLDLDVSVDAPILKAPNALGKSVREANKFIAELGAVDSLKIVKEDSKRPAQKTAVDVEQYFLMRPRPAQTDIRAAFKYQIVGGAVQEFEIECDPAFSFSGYCKSDVAEIESVDSPTAQNGAMKVAFKQPVSGAVTLNVDFVAKNFSGVGRIPLPRIAPKNARVVKNILALAPSAEVDVDAPAASPELNAEFLAGWGTLDLKEFVALNLDDVPIDADALVKVKTSAPTLEEKTIATFRPSAVDLKWRAKINATGEVFQIALDAPDPFVVDSVSLLDETNQTESSPEFALSDNDLTISFDPPLKGAYALVVDGRAKERVGVPQPFPTLTPRNVETKERRVVAYCSRELELEWVDAPNSWRTIVDEPENDEPTRESGNALFGSFVVDVANDEATANDSPGLAPNDAPTDATKDDDQTAQNETAQDDAAARRDVVPTLVAKINAPTLVGSERVFLYPKAQTYPDNPVWKAAYELRFKATSGRLDRAFVQADDLYELEPTGANSDFVATETIDFNGVKVVAFEPKRTIADDREYELFFSATFKGDPTAARAPQFRLLPSDLNEDYSQIERKLMLATLVGETRVEWETTDLVDVGVLVSKGRRDSADRRRAPKAESNSDAPVEQPAPEEVAPDQIQNDLAECALAAYARGEKSAAVLKAQGAALEVSLAEHEFYVNDRREIYGIANFSIRANQDSCTLVAPSDYVTLEARVNGVRKLVQKLESEDENAPLARWRVDLGQTPYVKRLVVSFQSSGRRENRATKRLSRRRPERFALDFFRLENARVRRALWTCAFEDFELNLVDAKWTVQLFPADASEKRPLEKECYPIPTLEANPILYRIAQQNASTLIAARDADDARLVGAAETDKTRFLQRRLALMRETARTIGRFSLFDANATLNDRQLKSIVVVNGGAIVEDEKVNAVFPAPQWFSSVYGDSTALREKLDEICAKDAKDLGERVSQRPLVASPETLWALEVGSSARILVGSSDANVASVVVIAVPKTFDFISSPYATPVFILMATAAALQLLSVGARRKRRKSVALAALIFLWTSCFFLLNQKTLALVGAFAITIGAPVWAAIIARRQRKSRENESAKDESRNAIDVSVTRTLELPMSAFDDSTQNDETRGSAEFDSEDVDENVSQLGFERRLDDDRSAED